MAIAYGVAMGKLALPIPSTCPEDWRFVSLNIFKMKGDK